MKKTITVLSGIIGIIIVAVCSILKFQKPSTSITVIGGADGPTSIFLAGKMSPDLCLVGIALGVILFIGSILLVIFKKK